MIDTICLITPEISEEIEDKIERLSQIRFAIDLQENKELYRFTSQQLLGSYDSRIRISIMRDKWQSYFNASSGKYIAEKVKCKPYLEIETSLHKFGLGHNIYGGSDRILIQVKNLIEYINKTFDFKLPDYKLYEVKRIDYARVYKVPDI